MKTCSRISKSGTRVVFHVEKKEQLRKMVDCCTSDENNNFGKRENSLPKRDEVNFFHDYIIIIKCNNYVCMNYIISN